MKNNIRELRREKKYRQEDLATALGVTRQTINAIENDKYDPTLLLAFKLANMLETRVDELFKPDPKTLKWNLPCGI
ncbi:MAG: helix-turn-helix transcriptional regulator [Intestinimonas sp.]|jgi:putative transcriptional regulator|nr:helix-turn-helix transcriptional regulator [Intestinimonas sp.]